MWMSEMISLCIPRCCSRPRDQETMGSGDENDWSRDEQAPVVQTSDSAIQRINHYPADSIIDFRNTYPLDSDLSGG